MEMLYRVFFVAAPDRLEIRPFYWQLLLAYSYRIVCPKCGHPAKTSFTKYEFLQVKNILKIVIGLSALKFFQLSNDDLLFS